MKCISASVHLLDSSLFEQPKDGSLSCVLSGDDHFGFLYEGQIVSVPTQKDMAMAPNGAMKLT